MSAPTEKELRELDGWLANHLFGWDGIEWHVSQSEFPEPDPPPFLRGHPQGETYWMGVPHYTTDPAAAMLVLDECAKQMSPDGGGTCPAINWLGDIEERWGVVEVDIVNGIRVEATELPLAISLFAKQLYSK